MVSDGVEILATVIQAKARTHARRLIALRLDTGLRVKDEAAIGAGIEAGIAGAYMALIDAGLLPSISTTDEIMQRAESDLRAESDHGG